MMWHIHETYASESVRPLVRKRDFIYDRKRGLTGEGEGIDEMIENVKLDEDMSNGSKVLRTYTTPPTIREE
jgi:hypothetical protein